MVFLNVRTRFCCHIDLLTHHEAVTGYPAGHRLASFLYLTWCHENLYLCMDTLKAKEYHHNLTLIPVHMSEHTSSHEASSTLPTESLVGREEKDPNVVTSVSDFIAKIAPILVLGECDGSEIFYRGHADENWKLQPSIFRALNGVEKEHQLFRDMVAHTPRSFSECKSAIDYLVQMQHYELPTRLLDVSTNPLVALYFACAEEYTPGELFVSAITAAIHGATFQSSSRMVTPENTTLGMAGAVAGAIGAITPAENSEDFAVAVAEGLVKGLFKREKAYEVGEELISEAREAATFGVKAGVRARGNNGAVYLFSIPEARVKHYDSDTVSILANLAKCSDREIDIYTEQAKGVVKAKVLEKFNKRDSIQILLRQIKEEKPYFEPLIRPNDLSSIFLVKAKYGNPRIINQAGAFFIFGLGLSPSSIGSGGRLTKRGDHEIPSAWIRHKFIIPKDKKQDILKELAQLGITESYLFPEMDKYAKELKKKYKL